VIIHTPATRCISPLIRVALCLLLAGSIHPAFAFDLDSDKPIRIESKSARLDDKAGTATYTGNVRVTQGEARLEAERIVLTRKEGSLTAWKPRESRPPMSSRRPRRPRPVCGREPHPLRCR